jgi:hypothetical protein
MVAALAHFQFSFVLVLFVVRWLAWNLEYHRQSSRLFSRRLDFIRATDCITYLARGAARALVFSLGMKEERFANSLKT